MFVARPMCPRMRPYSLVESEVESPIVRNFRSRRCPFVLAVDSVLSTDNQLASDSSLSFRRWIGSKFA